ncbi:MAG: redoxin domain-containing protein [Gemmataceae bacterium]|nr:redoxin domain-containing protein [Gemmataceae bacterium]
MRRVGSIGCFGNLGFMLTSICLLSCILTLGQPIDRTERQLTPDLVPGLELEYLGTYTEESLIPNALYQRPYRLEANMLVLDVGVKSWQVALMTTLRYHEAKQAADTKANLPSSVRLEIAKLDWQGRFQTADKKILTPATTGPPTLECGFILTTPNAKVGHTTTWDVIEPGQPTQRWQGMGTESIHGITCMKFVGVQQSPDWNLPRADRSSWRKRDTVWLHPQLLAAQRVERVIEHRDPAREVATRRCVIRYDLERHIRYPTRFLEERRQEIERAAKMNDEAMPLLKQPGGKQQQIDSLLTRVAHHIDRYQPTPYRASVSHLKTLLVSAKKGESPVAPPMQNSPVAVIQVATVGHRAPDFSVSALNGTETERLGKHTGKPVLIFFYNPATDLGKEVLRYVKTLNDRVAGRMAVFAMAVTRDVEMALGQHKEMLLPFPVLDGTGMRQLLGATDTPCFVVVDPDGIIRLAQTGWGYQTPGEIESSLGLLNQR